MLHIIAPVRPMQIPLPALVAIELVEVTGRRTQIDMRRRHGTSPRPVLWKDGVLRIGRAKEELAELANLSDLPDRSKKRDRPRRSRFSESSE